jgi:hypothetical protein
METLLEQPRELESQPKWRTDSKTWLDKLEASFIQQSHSAKSLLLFSPTEKQGKQIIASFVANITLIFSSLNNQMKHMNYRPPVDQDQPVQAMIALSCESEPTINPQPEIVQSKILMQAKPKR